MVNLIKNLYLRKTFNRMFLDDNVESLEMTNTQIVDIGGGQTEKYIYEIY